MNTKDQLVGKYISKFSKTLASKSSSQAGASIKRKSRVRRTKRDLARSKKSELATGALR